jgi:integrase/recombinase XerD
MYPHQKLILDKRRPKKSNLYPVKIRITFQRKQQYYSSGIDLNEEDFNRIINQSVRNDLRVVKGKLQDFEKKITSILDSLKEFSFHEFDRIFFKKNDNEKNKDDVYYMFQLTIDSLRSEGRIATANIYHDALISFRKFKPSLTFKEVDIDFLKTYEIKMRLKGQSKSTTGIYFRHLRAIFNKAIQSGTIDQKYYPFGKTKYQIQAPRNIKKSLTIEQIKKIISYPVKEDSTQHFVRDIWIFSYLCNGMNIKDILNLKYQNIDGDNILYDRAKTSKTVQNPKPIVISLFPQTINIINRWGNKKKNKNEYIFPIYSHDLTDEQKQQTKHQFIKTINKYMKLIGEEIGYDKPLTTYAARHSFATVLKRSGAPTEFISESLGHKSLQTTEAYLDSFEDESRRKFMEHLIPK